MKTRLYLMLFTGCIISTFCGCRLQCNLDMLFGEILEIPIQFNGFTKNELINGYVVVVNTQTDDTILYRSLDNTFTSDLDKGRYILTDNNCQNNGYYNSCLNVTNVYFTQLNTNSVVELKDVVVKKSKAKNKDKCYKDHPNVQIDYVSFWYNGQQYFKGDTVQVYK